MLLQVEAFWIHDPRMRCLSWPHQKQVFSPMPTVGWIQEGDIEAFLEGTDRPVGPNTGPPSLVYHCPFCVAVLDSERGLQDHVSEAHQVFRPIMLLSGMEPPREATVRSVDALRGIAFSNVTKAEIVLNGAPPAPMPVCEIPKALSGIRDGEVSLTLTNASGRNARPVSTTYSLLLRIAEPDDLKEVETAFLELIVPTVMTRASIDGFLDDPRCSGPGRHYAVGLAHYGLGILQKERPTSEVLTTPFSQYRDSFIEAQSALSGLSRPLARLVTQVVRFALNDFSSASPTGYWELDFASAALRDPGGTGRPAKPAHGRRRHVCPVDHGTGQILDLASRMLLQERWSPILDEECRQAAGSAALDAADRQKALAVWALSAWRLGAREHAVEPLRQIAATYPFSAWAEPYLETVTQ